MSFSSEYNKIRRERKQKNKDLFPIKTEISNNGWFKGSTLFEDGWQLGDVTKTILGTATDVVKNVGAGIVGMGEKTIDALVMALDANAKKQTEKMQKEAQEISQRQNMLNGQPVSNTDQQRINEQYKKTTESVDKETGEFVKKDLYDENKVAEKIISAPVKEITGIDAENHSVLGEKSDGVVQSVGQMGVQLLADSLFPGAGMALMGATAYGSQAEQALNEGANMDQAQASAIISAGAEVLIEKLFGGIKFGGKTLDDVTIKPLIDNLSNKTVKKFVNLGVDIVGEGTEESVTEFFNRLGTKLYKEENLSEILYSEEAWDSYLDSFIGGASMGGLFGGMNTIRNKNVIELTEDEKAVFDKEVEKRIDEAKKDGKTVSKAEEKVIRREVLNELQKGYIDISTIEEVLGGDKYESYKQSSDNYTALKKEYDQLNKIKKSEMTGEQEDRKIELKKQLETLDNKNDTINLKKLMSDDVYNRVKNSRLNESYNERDRRRNAFVADLSKYTEKQRTIVQKAIDSGILNNTNRTHEFVDMIAKISADKGVPFDFTNNQKLKESSLALDGRIVNGYVQNGTITINTNSAKALNSVVGHEITHILESSKFYDTLKNSVIEYSKTKGDYNKRLQSITKLYEGTDADIQNELVADLIGDYLFTDREFVRKLLAGDRNLFQKIFDEVKYLCKVATAGSKEARQLEKVKKTFEQIYRESTQAEKNTTDESGVRYALGQYSDKQISNWTNSKRIIIYKNDNQLLDFVNKSITGDYFDKKMYFGRVTTELANEIYDKTKINVENYNVSISSYEIRKIQKDHGNETYENLRGQRAVTPNDYMHIIDTIQSPEAIKLSKNKYNNKPAIEFKSSKNDKVTVVAVVSDKHLDLFVQTAYIGKKNRNFATPTTEQADVNTPKTSSGTVSTTNITDLSGNVNSKSLSEANSHPIKRGNYNVMGEDVTLTAPMQMQNNDKSNDNTKPLAPVREDVSADEYSKVNLFVDNGNLPPQNVHTSIVKSDGKWVSKTEFDMKENAEQLVGRIEYLSTKGTVKEVVEYANKEKFETDILENAEYGVPVSVVFYVDANDTTISRNFTKELNPITTGRKVIPNPYVKAPSGSAKLENLAPVDNNAKIKKIVNAPVREDMFSFLDDDNFAPLSEEYANQANRESFNYIDDADAPPEISKENYNVSDTTTVPETFLKKLSNDLQETLSLSKNQLSAFRDVIQRYSITDIPNKDALFNEIKDKFSEKAYIETNDEIADIKQILKSYKIVASNIIKGDIPDYNSFRKLNFGKLNLTNEGLPVDTAYMELSTLYPGFFPDYITNATDQLLRISEVANMSSESYETFKLDDETIREATEYIISKIGDYKYNETLLNVNRDNNQLLEEFSKKESKPIKTVKERLEDEIQNTRRELLMVQKYRNDAYNDSKEVISRLQMEYDSKKDKSTKTANEILQRIEHKRRIMDNIDASYAKRESDLNDIIDKRTKELKKGDSDTHQKAMRKELHQRIIDNIKAKFKKNGFDFDEVLKNAKNLATFKTVDNTPQRVMEKSLGYEEGDILADETVNKVALNESAKIKWQNEVVDEINKLSKKYHIKPGSKESAAAQMYAEGFFVNQANDIIAYGDNELAVDFRDVETQKRIKALANDPKIREIYDMTLNMINESRIRNAYPEIQRLDNYFLHFRAMSDTFSKIGLPFNPNDITAKDLPTDLNGVTADLKPGQPYFASANHRTGKRTDFDLLGGLEMYINSAGNQIYHIDDIQTLRAVRNYIADNFGQAKGLESLDSLPEGEVQDHIEKVYNSHLSTFAKFLNEEANVIAGKTALIDRGLEGIVGRRGITLLDSVNRQVGSNMVGFNISSSLTNILPVVQTFAKTNKFAFVKAMAQTTQSKLNRISGKSDSFIDNNPTVLRRKGVERFNKTTWQKLTDPGYILMSAVDNLSTEIIVRTKYNELTQKGMDEQKAIVETDKWVSRLMGDRSLGQLPQLYNSKMLGLFTKFQLEVRNQLDSMFYDTIQEAKLSTKEIDNKLQRNAQTAARVTSTFFQLAVSQHVFGQIFESVAGYNPAFDIIEVIAQAFGLDDDDDSEDTPLDNIEQAFLGLLEDLPYTSTFTGGRIPISSGLPIEEFITGKDQYGNEKSRLETIHDSLPYYVFPTGYGQFKKSYNGLKMFDEDNIITGSYTDSGNLRFPVEDTFVNRVQAGIFGQYANENAREYFDKNFAPLEPKQTEELSKSNMSIQDYRKYREDIKHLKTNEEKFDYIANMDISDEQKNYLINNLVNRDEYIDISNYNDFGSYEEFEFHRTNPEKWTLAKSVGGYNAYSDFIENFSNIKANKDKYGNSISGSKKNKIINYINTLDADYGEKIILFKSVYNADDTYNYEIVDYLNSRDDISYDEMVVILKELGFNVDSEGNVSW